MSGLFEQLLRLHRGGGVPKEDFLTELACTALRIDAAFARQWLNSVGVLASGAADYSVRTQVGFSGLSGHLSDARIDLVIELAGEAGRELVFVESKFDSPEGRGQLRRYAEILAGQPARQRHLVYLTARHDPKSDPQWPGVKFRLARWHDFHRLLARRPRNPLTTEILRFMEIKGLAQGDRFSPTDILALRNLRSLANLMEAVLGDTVWERLRAITGRTYLDTNLLKSMRSGGWLLEGRWDESQTGLSVGFIQPESDDPAAFPVATVLFWVSPHSPVKEAIRRSMREACRAGVWQQRALDERDVWFGMRVEKSLEVVLGEPDHVRALTQFFLEGLAHAEAWVLANPVIRTGQGVLPSSDRDLVSPDGK